MLSKHPVLRMIVALLSWNSTFAIRFNRTLHLLGCESTTHTRPTYNIYLEIMRSVTTTVPITTTTTTTTTISITTTPITTFTTSTEENHGKQAI